MSSIRYDKDANGIVTITLDAPGEAVNTMNEGFKSDLAQTVDRLEAEREQIKGVIITSAKSSFLAGGDLRGLIKVQPTEAETFFRGIEQLKSQLRRLEKLGRPVVAAINGHALGGGLELALSCSSPDRDRRPRHPDRPARGHAGLAAGRGRRDQVGSFAGIAGCPCPMCRRASASRRRKP